MPDKNSIDQGDCGGLSPAFWFVEGARQALSGPAFYVALALIGVGGVARAAGFPFGAAALSTVLMWAGPAQLLFFGAFAAKTAAPVVALSVGLSSIRLLPMCLTVLPMLRTPKTRLPSVLAAAHFIAVTVWAESLRRLPDTPRMARPPFFFGFALTCMTMTTISTGLGFWLMLSLPQALGAALLLLSPIYFLATLARATRGKADWIPIGFGAALAPITQIFVGDGFDLLVLGLVGGVGAYLAARPLRRRKP